ncbi:MAG: SOS response-associated peptidase [Bacteroidales bacterium]
MCFTIEVHLTRKAIEKRFSVDTSALYDFDFNYFYKAFSNPVIPVIDQQEPGAVKLSQWGLVPSWVSDREKAEQIRKGTYNARSESLAEKPSFREPLNRGRCLVIAHGFYEWQLVNGVRIPWYIRLKNNEPFAFAGICDQWTDPDTGASLHTFSIITTEANPLLARIHNTKKRMPVILSPGQEKKWIEGNDESGNSAGGPLQLLLPFNEDQLSAHTVSPLISKAGTDPGNPELILPYSYPASGSLF